MEILRGIIAFIILVGIFYGIPIWYGHMEDKEDRERRKHEREKSLMRLKNNGINKPIWINPETGSEWYVQENFTEYCKQDPPLNATCYSIMEVSGDERKFLKFALMHNETRELLCISESKLKIETNIDVLRFIERDLVWESPLS